MLSPAPLGLAAGVAMLTGVSGVSLSMVNAGQDTPVTRAMGSRVTPTTAPAVRQAAAPAPTRESRPAVTGPARPRVTTAATTPAAPRPTAAPSTSVPTPGAGRPVTRNQGALEQWAAATSPLYRKVTRQGVAALGAQPDPAAVDKHVLDLTIPAGTEPGPGNSAEIASRRTYRYGSFASRLRAADCSGQPGTGAVTGMFTYANDRRDHDGDGIIDNSEIDVEILCARPHIVNLTVWTDFRERDGAQQRVSRVVDMRTGQVLSTCYLNSFDGPCQVLQGAESSPSSVRAVPDFDASKRYYTYRFDWSADRVLFSVSDGKGQRVTLWDYQGPSTRIPHNRSAYLVNLWHTDTWTPAGAPSATGSPTAPLTASVDWSRITPLP